MIGIKSLARPTLNGPNTRPAFNYGLVADRATVDVADIKSDLITRHIMDRSNLRSGKE